MKRILTVLFSILWTISVFSQNKEPESTGGHFSLEGALDLFKKANSLEAFEKLLNQEENNVNNLDLNDDGDVDFIIVNAIKEGDTHVLVLSTYLKDKELQDIATIGIEKVGPESARLQIEGDPDLFSENMIVEPKAEGESSLQVIIQDLATESSGAETGIFGRNNLLNDDIEEEYISGDNHFNVLETKQIMQAFVNVWFWPGVRVLYAPGYVVWHSPWRWGLYPQWWKPWRPLSYPVFYKRAAKYRIFYQRVPGRSVVMARRIYAPGRSRSALIVHKNRRGTVVIKKRPGRVRAVRVKRGRRG